MLDTLHLFFYGIFGISALRNNIFLCSSIRVGKGGFSHVGGNMGETGQNYLGETGENREKLGETKQIGGNSGKPDLSIDLDI